MRLPIGGVSLEKQISKIAKANWETLREKKKAFYAILCSPLDYTANSAGDLFICFLFFAYRFGAADAGWKPLPSDLSDPEHKSTRPW